MAPSASVKTFLAASAVLHGTAAADGTSDLRASFAGGGLLAHMLDDGESDKMIASNQFDIGVVADCGPQCSAWAFLQQDIPALVYNQPGTGVNYGIAFDFGGLDTNGQPRTEVGKLVMGMATQDFDTWARQRCANTMGPSYGNDPLPWGKQAYDDSEDRNVVPPCLTARQESSNPGLTGQENTNAIGQSAVDTGLWQYGDQFRVGVCAADDWACAATASGGGMHKGAVIYQPQCSWDGWGDLTAPGRKEDYEQFTSCWNIDGTADKDMADFVREYAIPSWKDDATPLGQKTYMPDTYTLNNAFYNGGQNTCRPCALPFYCYPRDIPSGPGYSYKETATYTTDGGVPKYVTYLGRTATQYLRNWKENFAYWYNPTDAETDRIWDFTNVGLFSCKWFKEDWQQWVDLMKDNYATMWDQAYQNKNDYAKTLNGVPNGGAYLQNEVNFYADQEFEFDFDACSIADQGPCFKKIPESGCRGTSQRCNTESALMQAALKAIVIDDQKCEEKLAYLDGTMTADGGKLIGWNPVDGQYWTSVEARCKEYFGGADDWKTTEEAQITAGMTKAKELAIALSLPLVRSNFLSNAAVHPDFSGGSSPSQIFIEDVPTTAAAASIESSETTALGQKSAATAATGSEPYGTEYSVYNSYTALLYANRVNAGCRPVSWLCELLCEGGYELKYGKPKRKCISNCIRNYKTVFDITTDTCDSENLGKGKKANKEEASSMLQVHKGGRKLEVGGNSTKPCDRACPKLCARNALGAGWPSCSSRCLLKWDNLQGVIETICGSEPCPMTSEEMAEAVKTAGETGAEEEQASLLQTTGDEAQEL